MLETLLNSTRSARIRLDERFIGNYIFDPVSGILRAYAASFYRQQKICAQHRHISFCVRDSFSAEVQKSAWLSAVQLVICVPTQGFFPSVGAGNGLILHVCAAVDD